MTRFHLVCFLLFVAACPSQTPSETEVDSDTCDITANATARGDVDVDPAWQVCTDDEDCVVVNTLCDECCQWDVVSRDGQSDFSAELTDYCDANQLDGECDCEPTQFQTACEAGQCVVTVTQTAEWCDE